MVDFRWGPGALVGVVVVALAAAAGVAGVSAQVRLVGRPTGCDTTRAAATVLPALAAISIGQGNSQITGTGIIVRADGLILTSARLAKPEGAKIRVVLSNGEHFVAETLGTSAATQLGVLRIARNKLPALLLSPREPVALGQPLVALAARTTGSGGVIATLATGLEQNAQITAPGGKPTSTSGVMLTDTRLPGDNSGGPLVTCENRLVAVVIGDAKTGSAAIPAKAAAQVIAELAPG